MLSKDQMLKETQTQINRELTPKGFVLAPERKPRLEPEKGSLRSLEIYQQRLNKFLDENGFSGFRLAELPTNLDGSFVIHPPNIQMAFEVFDANGQVDIKHSQPFFKEAVLENFIYREVPPIQQIGDNLYMVSFAMSIIPTKNEIENEDSEEETEPKQFLMTMIMEKETAPKSQPVCMLGKLDAIKELEKEAPKFESIQLTQQQFDDIAAHYGKVEHQYGGKRLPLSPDLIAKNDQDCNVDNKSFSQASDKFYTVVTFHMKDGTTRTRLVNRAAVNPETGEYEVGNCYIVVANINGEKHIVVEKLNRLNGQAEGHEGIAHELPRGFQLKGALSHYIAEQEIGLSTEEINDQNKTRKKIKSYLLIENNSAHLNVHGVADEKEFTPTGEASEQPLNEVEQLVPSWMSVRNILEDIKKGEIFVDSFSIALIGYWLFENRILELKDETPSGMKVDEIGIIMEVTQNYTDLGEEELTLWNDQSDNFPQFAGVVNPNSGIFRTFPGVGYADQDATIETLKNANKPWKAVSLREFVEGMTSLRWDNVTMAAGLKMLLQSGFLIEHLEKLDSQSS